MTIRFAQNKWQSLDTLFGTGALGVMSDAELLECFRTDCGSAGHEAFRILVQRHGPMVLGLCRSLTCDPHDAEDAFQATFLVLVRKGHSIWVRDSVGPWLYGVAGRVAARARRRSIERQRRQVRLADDVALTEGMDCGAFAQETTEALHGEITRLPASLRAPIVLCALEGLSYDAAARQLGVTEPTLRGRLHRARLRLARSLRERGIASVLPATASEVFRLEVPPLPAALVNSTVQHATWWSSLHGLLTAETAIPASIAALARGVLRSMLLCNGKVLSIAAIAVAGIFGTVVLAQQAKTPAPAPNRCARRLTPGMSRHRRDRSLHRADSPSNSRPSSPGTRNIRNRSGR